MLVLLGGCMTVMKRSPPTQMDPAAAGIFGDVALIGGAAIAEEWEADETLVFGSLFIFVDMWLSDQIP
jgi:hypothetical protein